MEGHASRTEEITNAYKILVRNPKGKDHYGELGADGRVILGVTVWAGFIWLRIGTRGRLVLNIRIT
jgi:hypothetical protein